MHTHTHAHRHTRMHTRAARARSLMKQRSLTNQMIAPPCCTLQIEHTLGELQILYCCESRFIVRLFDHFQDKKSIYLSLEFVSRMKNARLTIAPGVLSPYMRTCTHAQRHLANALAASIWGKPEAAACLRCRFVFVLFCFCLFFVFVLADGTALPIRASFLSSFPFSKQSAGGEMFTVIQRQPNRRFTAVQTRFFVQLPLRCCTPSHTHTCMHSRLQTRSRTRAFICYANS